jgi:hypothetical protein
MPHPGSYGAAFSKPQDTVFVSEYRIFVFKMVAWACFFDQIAAPITTELLENPITHISYTIVVLASFPKYKWSKIALVNVFLRLTKWIRSFCGRKTGKSE